MRNRAGLELLDLDEHAVAGAEPDNDARHAQQERLDPELHQLALEIVQVPVRADLGRRLELHPGGRRAGHGGFGVPYWGREVSVFAFRAEAWYTCDTRTRGWRAGWEGGRIRTTVDFAAKAEHRLA